MVELSELATQLPSESTVAARTVQSVNQMNNNPIETPSKIFHKIWNVTFTIKYNVSCSLRFFRVYCARLHPISC